MKCFLYSCVGAFSELNSVLYSLNPLSPNLTKWSNTLKQFVGNLPTNCLTLFDHFVGLVLKGLSSWKTRLMRLFKPQLVFSRDDFKAPCTTCKLQLPMSINLLSFASSFSFFNPSTDFKLKLGRSIKIWRFFEGSSPEITSVKCFKRSVKVLCPKKHAVPKSNLNLIW